MGRPKGSKNKPKPAAPPKDPTPKLGPTVAPIVEKKKRGRKPKTPTSGKLVITEVDNSPVEIDLEQSTMGFYPLNMNNFAFTEHRLLKTADFVIFRMPANTQSDMRKHALVENIDFRIFVVKRMLKAAGLKSADVDEVLKEIENYRQTNKPEQLYLKYKKR